MRNPYLNYIEGIEAGVESARTITVSGTTEPKTGPTVMLFSPHPDDECITGLLPLRLMRERDRRIVNVPVTYGSNEARQAGRAEELAHACGYLGWEVFRTRDDLQSLEVADVVDTLNAKQPEVIVVPHVEDWNSRHISTHHMVMAALKEMDSSFSVLVVETEYWGALAHPNLMVEADAELVAELVAATSLHAGEVARNPYHLLLPAWLQDNVRRGGELVGGQGGKAPSFAFATLYRLRKWLDGTMMDALEEGAYVPVGEAALEAVL